MLNGCKDDDPIPTSSPHPPSCGPYIDQAISPYVLPYNIGESFRVGQGNCSARGRSHAAGSLDQHSNDLLILLEQNCFYKVGIGSHREN